MHGKPHRRSEPKLMKLLLTRSSLARVVGAVSFAAVGALTVLSSASCTVDGKATVTRKGVQAPGKRGNSTDFQSLGVSTVFEKRCGSLDCHGTNARNLRIYSSGGLRVPNEAGITPGGGTTTLEEVNQNYESIMDLEPEQMNEVLNNNADPETLLILKKPLTLEHHKGGPAITRGDDAFTCIESWLGEDATHPIDKTACTNAGTFPKN
jgi:hypothetical protein